MAEINVEQIQSYVDSLKDWVAEGDSKAKESLLIRFKKGYGEPIIDEERVNETLYLQSRNGNIAIEFDASGLIVNIEIS